MLNFIAFMWVLFASLITLFTLEKYKIKDEKPYWIFSMVTIVSLWLGYYLGSNF